MKIIHCSDLHLDSALGRNFTASQAKERNAELCATFSRMVRYALDQQVSALLIAGDLFDSAHVGVQTMDYILRQIRNAPDVTFFLLQGNHDGGDAFACQELPENLKTFGREWKSYRLQDTVITAAEPEGDGWYTMYDKLNLNGQDINIVMLHGQISTRAGEEMIALPLLRGKGIRYLALGHLHTYQAGQLEPDAVYCYSGCPEGRGFDECGGKGFVLLETKNDRISSRFVPFASRTLHEVDVDMTDADTVTQILARMEQAAVGIEPKDMVKFTLRGTYTLSTQKDLAFLQKMLEDKFHCVKMKDESRLKIDTDSYAFDASLKGELIRLVQASECSEDEKERIITCGIRALNGEEVTL